MEGKYKKIIIPAVIILFFVAGFLIYYLISTKQKPVSQPAKELTPEKKIKTQAEELEELRKEAGTKNLNEEEIKKQEKELEGLKKESSTKSLSDDEIKKQLEELEKLRKK